MSKASEIVCKKCGKDAVSASRRGAFLSRATPIGTIPAQWVCNPTCDHIHGNQDDALIAALGDSHE